MQAGNMVYRLLLLAGLLMGSGARGNTPSFVVPSELPGERLRIRLPARAEAVPLPPLERKTYQVRRGDEEWTEVRYDPHAIWLRSQHLGTWRDSHGNSLLLLAIRSRLPDGFEHAHVQREDYDARLAELPDLQSASSAVLLEWVEDWLGYEPGQPEVLRSVMEPLAAAAFVPTRDDRRLLYVFQVSMPQAGSMRRTPRNYAAEIRLAKGADAARARRSFAERFLRAIDILPAAIPGTGSGGGLASADAVHGDDASMQRSRAAARQSVANLRDWWSVDFPGYILLSNQRGGASQLVRDLEQDLPILRDAYRRLVRPLEAIRRVSVIRVFAEEDAYERYVGDAYKWTGGLWSDSRSELVIRPVEARHYRRVRDRVMATVYHEAFHQYLSYATGTTQPSVWFNEGHAEYFAATSLRNHKVEFEENASAAPLALTVPLDALFAMDYAQFYHPDDTCRKQHYAVAWALVYYLRRSTAADPDFPFAGLLDDYMLALAQTKDGGRATQMVLKTYDKEALEADFRAFWESERRRRAVLRASAFPEGR